ncbi:hypothetical protein [Duganella violaceipulchra]|uniref:Secretion system X translation initiation factor n=1 Tax=Duganella violaceipulchra TaxID=2849652 RepID=A0AA41HB20_9BURK|nr:hypothetical protein [Duganella violaceicalia]MBV6323969.1 hypothetical protein [Duganella violaceicalia]MCP2011049.1 hypothetical protein [Duganella violaceicalia]
MTPGLRRGVLGLALAATLLAIYFAPPEASAPASKALAAQRSAAGPVSAPAVLAIRPRAQPNDSAEQDDSAELRDSEVAALFEPAVVAPAPAAKPALAAPVAATIAPPLAPPLPFRALGRYVDGGNTAVFLLHNERVVMVRVGDVIADTYLVESLTGTTLALRYTPLNQRQTLQVGGNN